MPQATNIQANLQISTASLNQSSRQVQQALGRITGQASEFQKSLDASTARVFAFGATTTVLQAVNQSFKKLVSTTIEVEKRLVEINSIFQASASEFNKFRNAIFQVAKDTGQAFSTVAEGAAELARQGLSAEETAKRLEAALILTRISGLDAEKSVKSLTAAINGFASAGLTAEQIVNKMVAVDTAFAVSAQDLADGFARAGSTAEDAGVSFDELLGLITAVEQRTARGGAVIGNAFKSIFTRLSRGKTIDELKELGVQIDANQTGIQKLQALSAALEEISDPTVASKIKELAGGVFQINVVSSTLKDLSSDTSIFADAAATAANATNEAFEKNALLNQTLAAQINSLVASLTSFGEKIGQLTIAPLLGNLVTIATKVSEAFDKALDPEKGNKFIQGIFKAIGGFISGPGLILITTAFLKITMLVAKFAKEGFQAVLRIGSAQEKQAKVQAGIVGLLQRDAQLRKVLNSSTATQAQKEQAVIQAIQRENQLLQQQQNLLQNIVGLAARRGVAGYSPSGGFTGKRGKRFASGFQAEEATAMMLGATSGVKAKYGKGTIGGRKFIMNDQEMEITNFGRNGDSAVIPKYAKGFVPNFARSRRTNDPVKMAAAAARMKQREQQRLNPQEKLPPLDINAIVGNALPRVLTPTQSGRVVKTRRNFLGTNRDANFKFRMHNAKTKKNPQLHSEFKQFFTKGDLLKFAEKEALRFAQMISAGFDLPPFDPDNINKLTNVEGFYGAIRGAMGAIFDRAITSSVAINAKKADNVGGNYDVNATKDAQGLKRVEAIFGMGSLGSSKLADLKVGGGPSTAKSMIDKLIATPMLTKLVLEKHKQDLKKQKAKTKGRGKAAGFIPNFAMSNRGIPVSKIRFHQDKNGNPFITNTMDEPNGASDVLPAGGVLDAINRERQGIGMAASGFVPNFAAGAAINLLSRGKNLLKFGGRGGGTASKTAGQAQKAAQASKAQLNQINKNITLLQKNNAQLRKQLKDQTLSNRQRKKIQSKIDKNDKKLAQQRAARQSGGKMKPEGSQTASNIRGFLQFFAIQQAGNILSKAIGDDTATKRSLGDYSSAVAGGAATGAMFGGPIGAGIGALAMGAVQQTGEILDARSAKKAAEEGAKKAEDMLKRVDLINQAGGLSQIDEMIAQFSQLDTKEGKLFGKEIEQYKTEVLNGKITLSKSRKAAEKLNKAMEKGAASLGDFIYMDELGKMIQRLNESIANKIAEIDSIMIGNIDAAKEAERQIDIRTRIQTPNLTGVSKNIVDRGLQGEAAIASAQTAKQEDAQLRRQLMEEVKGLDLTKKEGQERKKEIEEELKKSAQNLQDKIDQGAVTLRNNLTAASAELKTTIKKLAEQQSQAFNQRLDFASSLKGKQLLPETVIDNINALKNAKTADERLAASQRLAQNRADLDAINPAIFKGILASQGMTPEQQEQLTRKVVEDAVRKSLEGSDLEGQELENVVQSIVEAQKEGEPDMDQTKTDIKNLNQEIENTRKRISDFGMAFDAETLNKSIAQIGASLDAFAQGTLDATQILGAFQSINIKAEKAIEEGNKRIGVLEAEIATAKTERAATQADLNIVKQSLGK